MHLSFRYGKRARSAAAAAGEKLGVQSILQLWTETNAFALNIFYLRKVRYCLCT